MADSTATIHLIKAIFQTDEEPPLRAIVDHHLHENIISRKCLGFILRFSLELYPLQPGRLIRDSNGNVHTVTEKVELVLSKSGAAETEQDVFLVSTEDRLEPSGSYDVILGRKWKEKFENRGSNGYRAAPTYIRGPHQKDERTKQEEERNRQEARARAQQADEDMKKTNRENNKRAKESIFQRSK